MVVVIGLVFAASAIAVVTDLSKRRIPNWLTVGLAVIAISVHAADGPWELLRSLGAMAIVLAVGVYAFSHHWFGGGDVKLAAASAAAFSFPDCIPFLLYTAIGGGIIALLYAARRRQFRGTLSSALSSAGAVMSGAQPARPQRADSVPYALAIASGALTLVLSKTLIPGLHL